MANFKLFIFMSFIEGMEVENFKPMYIFIQIEKNEYIHILRDIAYVAFPFLEEISLAKNRIDSLELLIRMPIPNLLLLDLSENDLCDVEILRKGRWPKLK